MQLTFAFDEMPPRPQDVPRTECRPDECHSGVGEATARLADVLGALDALPSKKERRAQLKCAINRVADVIGRQAHEIPADPEVLRQLLIGRAPAAMGIGHRRWQTILCLSGTALRLTGVKVARSQHQRARSAAWRELEDAMPTVALRRGLSSFLGYCTREGIAPADVTDSTFEAYRDKVLLKSMKRKPAALERQTRFLWNQAVTTVEGWPRQTATLKRHARFYSLPWEDFPVMLRADIDGYVGRADGGDRFDERYRRHISDASRRTWRHHLHQLCSSLVSSGFPIEDLTDLSVLVQPKNAKRALLAQMKQMGTTDAVSLGNKAWLMADVAQAWCRDPALALQLRKQAANFKVDQQGITERNQERLRQFDLPENVSALLALPAKVLRRAERMPNPNARVAREVMLAVAVEILIVAPMRLRNLHSLEVGRHLVTIGRGKARIRKLVLPRHETKTRQAFEAPLPLDSDALVEAYLTSWRHRITAKPTNYLFPNGAGGARDDGRLSAAISKFILRETGLHMHVHLFRHLAGKLHLDANESDMETVRRVLGHRSSETTAKYYAEQRTAGAFRAYDGTIRRLRSPETARKPKGVR